MKLHDWLQATRRFVHTHTLSVTGAGLLLLCGSGAFVIAMLTEPEHEVAAHSSTVQAASTSVSASSRVNQANVIEATSDMGQLPTSEAVPVETLPDPAATAITIYPTGQMVSNEPGGKRPVTLAVERQIKADQWLGDKLVIGPKESALTVDMLRKDGGDTGVYLMPAANPVEVADLYFTLTKAGGERLASSGYGLAVKALYGELVIPVETMKKSAQRDMNVQMHTDHTLPQPAGAQSTSMQVNVGDSAGDMYITLPIENTSLTSSQLKQLKVEFQPADGQKQYVDSSLTNYNETYAHGLRFQVKASGTYTIVLPV
ncbi:hypothetical protein [Paenibacillus wenxiniae]|uniref:Uncharacterized protein n=1 Tax=Paenibacillus wenxiniae TaxID=1636843 RepID=A0ABW4RG65_9BACL